MGIRYGPDMSSKQAVAVVFASIPPCNLTGRYDDVDLLLVRRLR